MTPVNLIKVYSYVSDRYLTDGTDVYVEIAKEPYAKCHRIKVDGVRKYIRHPSDCPKNYCLIDNKLFRRLKWQCDKDGYLFIMAKSDNGICKIAQHRLVYFYVNNINDGNFVIDHINRCKEDNNIWNLRLVSCAENSNNVDIDLVSKNRSKYLYEILDMETNQSFVGYARKLCSIMGMDVGLINRYAKHNFIFKNRWKVVIVEGG